MTTETLEPQDAETPTDKLAAFREQVREEAAQKPRIGAAQAARLRAMNEQGRLERFDEGRFATALTHLRLLISRCSSDQKHLDRRAAKLAHWIERGYKLGEHIHTPYLVMFFSWLTPDEEWMSDTRFAEEWRLKRGQKPLAPIKPWRQPSQCALRSRCLRAEKRTGRTIEGRGRYCSPACAGRAAAIRRGNLTSPVLQ